MTTSEKHKKTSTKKSKTSGGVNLAPLISAVLLAAVKIGLEESRRKKGERTTKSRSRTQTRTK
jgi:hypothetical protein